MKRLVLNILATATFDPGPDPQRSGGWKFCARERFAAPLASWSARACDFIRRNVRVGVPARLGDRLARCNSAGWRPLPACAKNDLSRPACNCRMPTRAS